MPKKFKYEYVGDVTFTENKISATDPCYDADVYCRMDNIKIVPGTYECYIQRWDCGEWGDRVARVMIMLKGDALTKQKLGNTFTSRSYRMIGTIGVDSGTAGFFQNKPDFTEKEYEKYVHKAMFPSNDPNTWKKCVMYSQPKKNACGFFATSGYGDGVYAVHAIRNDKRKITAVEIRFM